MPPLTGLFHFTGCFYKDAAPYGAKDRLRKIGLRGAESFAIQFLVTKLKAHCVVATLIFQIVFAFSLSCEFDSNQNDKWVIDHPTPKQQQR